jgi:hypothetical protein
MFCTNRVQWTLTSVVRMSPIDSWQKKSRVGLSFRMQSSIRINPEKAIGETRAHNPGKYKIRPIASVGRRKARYTEKYKQAADLLFVFLLPALALFTCTPLVLHSKTCILTCLFIEFLFSRFVRGDYFSFRNHAGYLYI